MVRPLPVSYRRADAEFPAEPGSGVDPLPIGAAGRDPRQPGRNDGLRSRRPSSARRYEPDEVPAHAIEAAIDQALVYDHEGQIEKACDQANSAREQQDRRGPDAGRRGTIGDLINDGFGGCRGHRTGLRFHREPSRGFASVQGCPPTQWPGFLHETAQLWIRSCPNQANVGPTRRPQRRPAPWVRRWRATARSPGQGRHQRQ
jgi:hypothetical protein